MDIDITELLNVFLAESEEQVATLESDILELERSGASPDLIQELFRVAHTLKGGAASLGLSKLAMVTHALESAMGKVRDGERAADGELVDVLLACLDAIRHLQAVAGQSDDDIDVSVVLQQLEAIAEGSGVGPVSAETTPVAGTSGARDDSSSGAESVLPLTERDRELIAQATDGGETVMMARVTLAEDCAMRSIRFALIISELAGLGNVLKTAPSEADLQAETCGRQLEALIATKLDAAAVAETVRAQAEVADAQVVCVGDGMGEEDGGDDSAVQLLGEILVADGKVSREDVRGALGAQSPLGQILVDQRKVEPQDLDHALQKQEQQRVVAAQGIRVDMRVLDGLMNLIGEAAVVSTRVSRVTKGLHTRRLPEIVDDVEELTTAADLSERISEELQTVLLDMRLLPIRTIFQKFPRVVRDVARAGEKEIELETRGGETLVDKAVLDRLGDPLMHAIRNAADHGIEPPAERQAQGKRPCGTVTLQAGRAGDNIVIEVNDDGRGMDAQKIRQKAVEKGIITSEGANVLGDDESLRLILRPGFSTVDQVTDISGRGVGMDVVTATMKDLSGSVDIRSEAGVESTLRLTIPVKKLMMDLLLVAACGQRFGVPLELVAETTLVHRESIRLVDGRETTFLRGQLLGLARLRDVMALGAEADAEADELHVVVLALDGKRLGVVVDRIEDHQDIMLKPLEWEFGELRGIAGAAVLGNGEVVMVLEPEEIAELARETQAVCVA